MSSHVDYKHQKKYSVSFVISEIAKDGICIENPFRSDFIWVDDKVELKEFAEALIKAGEDLLKGIK
jgi:hypothetical protein